MKRLLYVTSLVVCASAGASASQAKTAPRSVYVSLTEKGSAPRFLNRQANAKHQLLVTEAPVSGALASRLVTALPNQRLVLVELQAGQSVPGELARFDDFAVVSLPDGQDVHDVTLDHRIYSEDVAQVEHLVPALPPMRLALREAEDGRQPSTISLDRAFLEQKLKEFSGAVPTTVGGRVFTIIERRSAANSDQARAWLKEQYDALGFSTSEHVYSTSGKNFIAQKVGNDATRFVLLTSHMDSVGNAGADDNGAGTIADLAIAQALANSALKYTLRVVAFDQEETGLIGSAAYARFLDTNGTLQNLVGVVNIEMLGYDADNDGAIHVIDCNENTSADLTRVFDTVITRDTALNVKKVAACTNRSDHASFWRYDRPAIVISQNFFGGDSNPCYHQACDRVDKINFDYMTRVSTAVARGVAEMLEAQ